MEEKMSVKKRKSQVSVKSVISEIRLIVGNMKKEKKIIKKKVEGMISSINNSKAKFREYNSVYVNVTSNLKNLVSAIEHFVNEKEKQAIVQMKQLEEKEDTLSPEKVLNLMEQVKKVKGKNVKLMREVYSEFVKTALNISIEQKELVTKKLNLEDESKKLDNEMKNVKKENLKLRESLDKMKKKKKNIPKRGIPLANVDDVLGRLSSAKDEISKVRENLRKGSAKKKKIESKKLKVDQSLEKIKRKVSKI